MTREEAIKIIESNCSCSGSKLREACAMFIPELAMSDDERIRKSLVKFLTEIKEISESGRTSWAVRKEDAEMCKSFIDYLEKQKEQSITANDLDEEIHRFFDDCIEVHDAKIYGVDERVITVDCYEITARHFAKWGEKQKEQKPAGATINGEPIPTENHSVDIPLTEWSDEDEQRIAEIEFAVMQMNTKRVDTKDKCLAWLKSLRPQQKVEWSEEDADMLNCCISSIEEAKENRYAYKETDGDTSYDREIDWLKSLPERLNLQPKQGWNDEDTAILKIITSDVARMMHKCGIGTDEWNIRSKVIRWLENLCPNQKSEWSEEDEENISTLIEVVHERMGLSEKRKQYYEKWLKSLRHKPHTVSTKDATKFGNLEYERGVKDGIQSEKSHQWKPTEEQIYSLSTVVKGIGNVSVGSVEYNLKALYEQLKKLM